VRQSFQQVSTDHTSKQATALLLRIVGWRRRIVDVELPAASELEQAGLIRLEIRIEGYLWGEATAKGMDKAAPALSNASHGKTIARYWKSRGQGNERPTDECAE
jgi:hypothetical protein